MNNKTRLIAFYLPQFHPIPENDSWWGKGFTEWTNVGRARKLFPGHYQPHVPADLGYYDLRLPQVREAQAAMAMSAGIEGFMYWHYWFGNGKRLLEMPFNEVLNSGKPDYPFCLGWANHSWEKKTWEDGRKNEILVEQMYSHDDYRAHFFAILDAFKDQRYMKVNGCPIFLIWSPTSIPNFNEFMSIWNGLANDSGMPGIHFVAYASSLKIQAQLESSCNCPIALDLMAEAPRARGPVIKALNKLANTFAGVPKLVSYKSYTAMCLQNFKCADNQYPVVLPNYDHSPRSGSNAIVFLNSAPKLFGKLLHGLMAKYANSKSSNANKIIFIKSWNEWGEGNHVEPDLRYRNGYIQSIRESLDNS